MGGVRSLRWGAVSLALLCVPFLVGPSAALAKAWPSTFKSGPYAGTTSQDLSISFKVSQTRVSAVRFVWRGRCADGTRHTNTIYAGGGPIENGRFSLGGTLNTGGRFHVDGKLQGGGAVGHLSRSGPSAFGTNCRTAGVTWQARLKHNGSPTTAQRVTYKGTTSQGLPISFIATPTAILSLDYGWTALCADGQTHSNTISAGGGPIDNGSFSLGGILNTGGTFHVDGTLNGTSASGTLSRSGPSAFGTFDCTASGVTWDAQVSSG